MSKVILDKNIFDEISTNVLNKSGVSNVTANTIADTIRNINLPIETEKYIGLYAIDMSAGSNTLAKFNIYKEVDDPEIIKYKDKYYVEVDNESNLYAKDLTGKLFIGKNTVNWPSDCSYLFQGSNLEEVNFAEFDTSDITTFGAMFAGSSNLKKVNIKSLDFSNQIVLLMFSGCTALQAIDLSSCIISFSKIHLLTSGLTSFNLNISDSKITEFPTSNTGFASNINVMKVTSIIGQSADFTDGCLDKFAWNNSTIKFLDLSGVKLAENASSLHFCYNTSNLEEVDMSNIQTPWSFLLTNPAWFSTSSKLCYINFINTVCPTAKDAAGNLYQNKVFSSVNNNSYSLASLTAATRKNLVFRCFLYSTHINTLVGHNNTHDHNYNYEIFKGNLYHSTWETLSLDLESVCGIINGYANFNTMTDEQLTAIGGKPCVIFLENDYVTSSTLNNAICSDGLSIVQRATNKGITIYLGNSSGTLTKIN